MKNSEFLEPRLAIRTDREYDAAVERLNALVDEIGDNPKAPRYRLIKTLSVPWLLDITPMRWRRLDGAHLLRLVRAGVKFVD